MSEPIDGTPAPDKAAGTSEQQPSVDYEAKYKGLNKAHQEKLQEYGQFQGRYAALETEAGTLKAQAAELQKAKAELDVKLADEAKAREAAQLEAATFREKLERSSILLENPDLAPYEAKGILRPDLKGDEFKAFLQTFRQTLEEERKGSLKQTLQGALPNSSPQAKEGGELNKDTLIAQHEVAMNKRDWDEADRIWKLLAALETKKA